MFLLRAPKRIFLRVPKPLPDPLIQGWFRGRPIWKQTKVVFWRLYIKKCTKKHEEYSWNFTCAHVIHARVFNGGAIARGAVLTWHLNDFVGRGWVGWWLIQGMWVGAATTDTRVVVGGLVVLSDFVPKRFFLRVPERILRVPKQLPDPLIQGAAHLNAKNDFLKTLHQEMHQKTWRIFL